MKEKIFYIIFLFVFLPYSCTVNKDVVDNDVATICLSDMEQRDILFEQGKPTNCCFVKLETTDSCLIGYVKKLIVEDDLMFLMDSNDKIYVFDINGQFKNSIGRVGQGPQEQLSIYDFFVDTTTKNVLLYDIYGSKIFRYSYHGQLQQMVKCDNSLLQRFSNIVMLNDKKMMLCMDNDLKSGFNYRLLNDDFSHDKDYFPFLVQGRKNVSFKNQSKITKSNGQTYVVSLFSDTIYQYKDNRFHPKVAFNSGLKPVTKEFLNEGAPYEFIMDVFGRISREGYSRGIGNIYGTQHYIYFPYFIKGDFYEIYWNLEQQNGYYVKNRESTNIFVSLQYLLTTTPEALVCVLPVDQILMDQQGKTAIDDSRIEEVVKNTKEDDNPVIGFYYLK